MFRGRNAVKALLTLSLIVIAGISPAMPVEVWPGVVVVNLAYDAAVSIPEEGAYRFGAPEIDRILDEIGATRVEVKFWGCYPPVSGGADITRYHNVYFPDDLDPYRVAADIAGAAEVESAEPWFVDYIVLDHNDPQRRNQYALNLMQANEAHDLATGDPAFPVAIIDTGVDLQHPDLTGNIWVNLGEDANGDGVLNNDDVNNRDDDGNGKRDDFNGWDFVGNSNDPDDRDFHGTHCAGIASAITNNNRGIASIGYSCSIMAVRSGSGMTIQYGYEGIQYAVRAGAKVLSLSWGGYGNSDVARAIVEYAHDHNVVVIAAAGNDNVSQIHYPAGYQTIIAVAATDDNDRRAGFSNYGDWIDVSAPGENILSTIPGNRYEYLSGTSMACPYVAGEAILIRSAFPNMSADEVRTIIEEGADNIDENNPNYRGRLGSGRINAFQSLQMGNRPILTIEELRIVSEDDNNGRIDPGETASIAVTISNGQNSVPTEGLHLYLASEDAAVTVNVDSVGLVDLGPGESVTSFDEPFSVTVNDDPAHTSHLTVTLTAEPGGLELSKTFEVVIGHPNVIIVDDDEGSDTELDYFDIIESAGHGWQRWDVATQFSPDAATLQTFNLVIWATGAANPPLDELDRWQIESTLQEGGNIMLVGPRIGDDEANRDMLRNFFGARHESDSVRAYTVEGIAGNRPIPRNFQMPLPGGDARMSPSTMTPVMGADSLVNYHLGDILGVGGVYRYNRNTEAKTVYLGFAFEKGSDSRTPRSDYLARIYEWFMADPNATPFDEKPVARLLALEPAYPNPLNGMVNFKYAVPAGSEFRLYLSDPSGRELGAISSGVGRGTPQIASFDASAFGAGVYFARLAIPGESAKVQRFVLIK